MNHYVVQLKLIQYCTLAIPQLKKKSQQKGILNMQRVNMQNIVYKIGSRVYCTTQGIQPIFCYNFKWEVTFNNCI